MSQTIIPEGIKIGSSGFYIFSGAGNPNSNSTGLLVSTSVAGVDSVALGSLFIDVTTGNHWVKTAPISFSAPSGVWTQIAIP